MIQGIVILKEPEVYSFALELCKIFNIQSKETDDSYQFFIQDGKIEDTISILEALVIDLDAKVKIYVSGFKKDVTLECEFVKKLLVNMENGVYYGAKFAKALSLDKRKEFLDIIFSDFKPTENIWQFLEGFFNSDLNASLAATTLYLHRNTLLYRLNNFHQRTGFDLKRFNDSALLYSYILDNK